MRVAIARRRTRCVMITDSSIGGTPRTHGSSRPSGAGNDMSALNQRIEDIVRVLGNFNELREPGRYGKNAAGVGVGGCRTVALYAGPPPPAATMIAQKTALGPNTRSS